MPQHLTVKQAKAAARKAYKAGKLTAQHRDRDKRQCHYAIGSCRCAIGAALSPATLKLIKDQDLNSGYSVNELDHRGLITTDDIEALSHIQHLHDTWCDRARTGLDPTPARRDFLEAIKA